MEALKQRIEAFVAGGEPDPEAVHETIGLLDSGVLRVAECVDGEWIIHEWVRQAILLYFRVAQMEVHELGAYEFYDKIPLKKNLKEQGVRLVPPGHIRFGAHVERGAVVMPGYVNIGAYVGSCAQIGKNVHLSGGVGIGGVLEPLGARPVIIEDGAFIGSRCIVVEGVHIGEEAVLGANVVLTASTPIVDVTGSEEVITKGFIPPRAVVIPGTRPKRFPAGEYGAPCALIIGQRKESTDKKTSLNQVLREFAVAV
jgi:2,3,4,5-tetrahydropyridine-2-carboxylate N-succinyltransferase